MPTKVTDLTAKTLDFVDDDVFMVDKWDSDLEVYTSEKYTWAELKLGLKVYTFGRDFSSTEILGMPSVGREMIAQPGANKIIFVKNMFVVYKGGATPYTTSANIQLLYDDGGSGVLIDDILTPTQLTTTNTIPLQVTIDSSVWTSANSNRSVNINANGAITAGDGVFSIYGEYILIDYSAL